MRNRHVFKRVFSIFSPFPVNTSFFFFFGQANYERPPSSILPLRVFGVVASFTTVGHVVSSTSLILWYHCYKVEKQPMLKHTHCWQRIKANIYLVITGYRPVPCVGLSKGFWYVFCSSIKTQVSWSSSLWLVKSGMLVLGHTSTWFIFRTIIGYTMLLKMQSYCMERKK